MSDQFIFKRWRGQLNPPKGHWIPFKDEREGAICTCPECGDSYQLGVRDVITPAIHSTHRVADDGTVKPSVVCCEKFHKWVTLEGWADRHKPESSS